MDLAADAQKLCEKKSTTLKFIAAILCVLGGVALTNANYGSSDIYEQVYSEDSEAIASFLLLSVAQAGGGVAALVQLFAIMSGEDDELRATILAGIYSVFNLGAAILMIVYFCNYGTGLNFGCWILLVTTIGATVVYIIDFILCILHK